MKDLNDKILNQVTAQAWRQIAIHIGAEISSKTWNVSACTTIRHLLDGLFQIQSTEIAHKFKGKA